jgi:hypothetical protein
MAKVFNGRAATEEYMSTHSLTFSTPDMTLRKFAIWLGDQMNLPDGEQGPRSTLKKKAAKKSQSWCRTLMTRSSLAVLSQICTRESSQPRPLK